MKLFVKIPYIPLHLNKWAIRYINYYQVGCLPRCLIYVIIVSSCLVHNKYVIQRLIYYSSDFFVKIPTNFVNQP